MTTFLNCIKNIFFNSMSISSGNISSFLREKHHLFTRFSLTIRTEKISNNMSDFFHYPSLSFDQTAPVLSFRKS